MCQILCLTSHDPAKRDEIIVAAWKQMALTQKDGYGAAWFSPDGQIGYYKRRHPRISEKTETKIPFVTPKITYGLNFEETNDLPSDGGFLIIHGRNATGDIKLANTHPMLGENTALIHNGSVQSEKYSNIIEDCTCDSELILQAYTEGGIMGVENNLTGWYAFMLLKFEPPTEEELAANPNAVGKKSLHIAKDARSSLHCGLMPNGSYAMATTEFLLEKIGADVEGEFKSYAHIIFNDPKEYTYKEFTPVLPVNKYKAPLPEKPASGGWLGGLWGKNQEEREKTIKNAGYSYPPPDKKFTETSEKYTQAEEEEIERLKREPIINI